ncbi:MAG: cation:proton antiporter [Myxococcales bacterium]|nr:cation:proton antiporter [Myxococcales bacterium]
MTEEQLLLFLVQVFVVLGLARLMGEVFRRFDQPPFAGEILAGVLLGQTVLGTAFPELFHGLFPDDELQLAMFEVTAEIGILFLLLAIGLEVDVANAWKLRSQSFSVAVTGVVVPLVVGFGMAWWLFGTWGEPGFPRIAYSLFVAAAVSITAITIVARLLFDLKIVKSDLGLLLLSAMAINELLGWVVLAVVMGMIGGAGGAQGVRPDAIAAVVLGTILFSAVCASIGRAQVTKLLRWFDAQGLPSPATPLSFVVCLGLVCGIITAEIGVHPIFGFLIAGVMAGDHKALSEHTRSVITQMVEAIFVPLFFAGICLHVDFVGSFEAGLVAVVTVVSVFGKFFGAWLGTWLVRMPAFDRLPIAIAHIPGGSMGVLLAVVGRNAGLIGEEVFVAIVFASIASALVVGPALAWSLRRREEQNVLGFFVRDGLIPGLAAETRHDVIDELVECAGQIRPRLDLDVVRGGVHAREEMMGTGVGRGIAIPHARLEDLERPLVLLGISRAGVDWDAIDDQPAHLVFLILTPADDRDSQLEILHTIASGVDDERAHDLLYAESSDEMWTALLPVFNKDREAGEGLRSA